VLSPAGMFRVDEFRSWAGIADLDFGLELTRDDA
jgi:hypothetical protein